MHHIVFLSEGGPDIEDNLMLVDPTCHAKIHQRPDLYPRERLKEAKRHWEMMRDLIPVGIRFEAVEELRQAADTRIVRFVIKSFNLDYDITVPGETTIGELTKFISIWIMRPIFLYAKLAPYKSMLSRAEVHRPSLALLTNPEEALPASLKIRELAIGPDDALVALVDLRTFAALEARDQPVVLETITLTWGRVPRDLDLHFFGVSTSGEAHVSFRDSGSLERFPWAKLDTDIRDGFGPERISFGALVRGKYRIAVHNFSNDADLSESGAMVEIRTGKRVKQFQCPREGAGSWWIVADIDVDESLIIPQNILTESPV